MILIRDCSGHRRTGSLRPAPDRDMGLRRQRRHSPQGLSGGAENRGPGHRCLRHRPARSRTRRYAGIAWWVSPCLCRREDREDSADESTALSALPHAGGAATATAIAGLGAQLKLEQRREALSRGIRLMEWTFDPLEIKNAHLNIHKLGAIVRCYHVNFYGVSSSRLQGGLPTDRLVAEWYLDLDRVTDNSRRQSHRRFYS